MIISKEVEVNVNNKNIKHFKEFLPNIKYGDIINISVEYLSKYSKYRILAKCEICGSENELSMQKYSQNKDRGGIYTCKSCNNITYKQSMINKYGVDNSSKCEEFVNKRKKTCLEKYGNEYVINSEYSINKSKNTSKLKYGGHWMKLDEFKFKGTDKSNKTKTEKGLIIPSYLLSDFEIYRKEVRKLTRRKLKEMLESWDGFDYYDGMYIKDNFNYKHTDPKFPTIDHKISIIYGYLNNIPIENIADISNLCFTTKSNNSSKSFLIENEYKNKKTQ